jgi:hypothetical protein
MNGSLRTTILAAWGRLFAIEIFNTYNSQRINLIVGGQGMVAHSDLYKFPHRSFQQLNCGANLEEKAGYAETMR